jgi:tripartite-type tricarboxylate transporter receptor subunit TctC
MAFQLGDPENPFFVEHQNPETALKLNRRQFTTAIAATTLVPLASTQTHAGGYPERPITFICPWPAGGTADQTMRALCAAAARDLGQAIAVENKAGAAGMIGLKAMAAARPDGYTIGQIPISVTRFSQLGTVQIDPLQDLIYLARTSGQTFGIAVQTSSRFKTLQDLVKEAKANPGKITYAHAGVGGATHVGMEEFAIAAGIQFNHIPFKGGAEALQGVMGGHVDVLVDSSSWAPHVEAGKLRLLATWGEQRTARFKDVPTLRDAGYNVVVDAPNGIGAPKGLDPAITARLRQAFKAAVASNEFRLACEKIDAPLLYLDGPDYEKYVSQVYRKETQLIERLKLKELMKS